MPLDPLEATLVESEAAAPFALAPAPAVVAGPRLATAVRAPWSLVILLGVLTAFGSVAMDMYLPALPDVSRALSATPERAQLTISVFLTGLALGQLFWGPLSDRVGRRSTMLAGIALFLVGSAACAFAATMEQMIAARFVQAMGACAGQVVPRAVVRDRYDDSEVLHVFSMLSLVFGVAPILAPLAGGLMLTVMGWRWIFGAQALFGVVMAVVAWRSLPESRSEETRARARGERVIASYASLLRSPELLGLLLTASLAGAAFFAFLSAAPEIVITIYHVPASAFGWVFGVNSLAWIGAGQINARLARRVPSRTILRSAIVASLPLAGVVLIAALTDFGGALGVLVPLFFTIGIMGFIQPNATALAMTVDRTRAGATAALLGASFFGVGGLAGLAVAALHDGTPRPMAIVLFGALAMGAVSTLLLIRPQRPTLAEGGA